MFQQGTEKSATSPNRKLNEIEIWIRTEKEVQEIQDSNCFPKKNSRK